MKNEMNQETLATETIVAPEETSGKFNHDGPGIFGHKQCAKIEYADHIFKVSRALSLYHFGLCPICQKTDGYLNVGKSHWFFCLEHKNRWNVGSNLLSTWREQTVEQQKALYDQLDFGNFTPIDKTYFQRLPDDVHVMTC